MRLERHKAAELNRELLRRAITEKAETPDKPPASFNKLWNSARTFWAPLNIVVSKGNPEDLVIFWKRQPIATISRKSCERLIANMIRLNCEHELWLEKQGIKPSEETGEEDQQEESSEGEDDDQEESCEDGTAEEEL
jgi:hypothetical protein